MIRYSVIASLSAAANPQEYIAWLKEGHVQAVVDEGKALSAQILVHDKDESEVHPKIESSYVFRSRDQLQAYFDGPAARLRADGVARFVDTGKISFSRTIAEINQEYTPTKHKPAHGAHAHEKSSWPECVHLPVEEAKAIIERERPDLHVAIVPKGAMVTMDMRMDRVRLYHNNKGNVSSLPKLG